MMKYFLPSLTLLAIVGVVVLLYHHKHAQKLAVEQAASYNAALAMCRSFKNDWTQKISSATKVPIYLPKEYFDDHPLLFETVAGTATAHIIQEDAVQAGATPGAGNSCYSYYYQFDGSGQVDLAATTQKGEKYTVHFQVQ